MYVILENIRSAHNVGSIFRTADAAGARQIYLCGYTPLPVDRFGRTQPEIAKTSLGAAGTVSWEHHEDISALMNTLRESAVTLVAVEQHAHAIAYTEALLPVNCAYIFGNEVDGVSGEVLETADRVIDIPMSGTKESLNVSVSAGIILFHARDFGG
jgi:23S rRNA (guanosine2251-2'-O)-methyltransferase